MLLCGGTKRLQQRDIRRAQAMARQLNLDGMARSHLTAISKLQQGCYATAQSPVFRLRIRFISIKINITVRKWSWF
jgi:hypothetical protein